MTDQTPPEGLSERAAALWAEVLDAYTDWSPDALATLKCALQAWDRMQAAGAVLDVEGLLVKDRFGQKRVHPLVAVERDSRAAFLSAIKALGLDQEPKQQRTPSEHGTRAAMMRWHGRAG